MQDSSSRSEPRWLEDLNPEQREAATAGDGPILVVAGAGTGKTKTLAYRVAWLVTQGVDPERILLLTFTRRASEEMLRRAGAIASRGTATPGRVWGGTFHATANRLLRLYAKAANLPESFTVMDRSDSEDLLNVIRHEMGLSSREKRFPRKSTCLDIYSRCVNATEALDAVLKRHFPWCQEWHDELKALFQRYVAAKQDRAVLDYDDLLLYWKLLVEDESLARSLGGRFDHILVDEYQDTNRVQAEILLGMRRFNPNILVVGDDAQSIYGFRAADVRNILDFPKQFPGTRVVTLERNYRSVQPILEVTNAVIGQASERFTKNLWSDRQSQERPKLIACRDEKQQDDTVVARVLEHYEQGIPLRRQAVLFRAAHLSDSLEVELTRRNIPFHKYGGLRFLEAAHVKDLVSFLRILENPRDGIAWFRVLGLLQGVGPTTAARALAHVAEHGHDGRSLESFQAPPAAREEIALFARLLKELLGEEKLSVTAQIERIRLFYDPLLERVHENPGPRRRDLEQLASIAEDYRSRRQFLTDLTLDPPTSTGDLAGPPLKDEDWLVLSTIHSSKGGEWDVVYLIHASDGCLPSDMAAGSREELAEELRLAYVAMTRARDFLYVMWPLRYYHTRSRFTDAHSYAQVSRFLPEGISNLFDRTRPDAEAAGEGTPEERLSPRDIQAAMRKMWE